MRLLLYICFFVGFSAYSQKTGNTTQINSWQEIAADKSLSNEERTQAYLSIIHRTKNQPDSVLVDAYKQLSRLARSAQRYDVGVAYCDTLLKQFPNLDFLEKKHIQIDRANVYKASGDNEKAVTEYFNVLREFEEKEYWLESAKLHSKIAVIFKNTDRIESAIEHLNDCLLYTSPSPRDDR